MWHKTSDWNTNWFDPQSIAPSKPRRAPSPVPDARLLFQIQSDMLKALEALKRLPVDLEKDDSDYSKARRALKFQLENAYKLHNRYLRTYVNNEPNQ